MRNGAFSVSLAVRDLAASKAFYEALGFEVFGGDFENKWLMLRHGDHVLGLFQGMFDHNILTFNPGWDQGGRPLPDFDDIRLIEKSLMDKGLSLSSRVEGQEGPGYFTLEDPDGNQILFDQHR